LVVEGISERPSREKKGDNEAERELQQHGDDLSKEKGTSFCCIK